jgi:hypothetical protein
VSVRLGELACVPGSVGAQAELQGLSLMEARESRQEQGAECSREK